MRKVAKLVLQYRKVLAALRSPIGRRALRRGVVGTLEPQPMLRRLDPSTVIDVGANRGQFSVDVLTVVPGAKILAFEPLRGEAAVFRGIFAGSPNVELIEVALGAQTKSAQMHVAGAADSSSLLAIGGLQGEIFPGTSEVGTVAVDVDTLDRCLAERSIAESSLLKMDVQGYELEVLRGAQVSLERIRWVYVELSFVELYLGQPLAREVMQFLADQNFGIADSGVPTRVHGRTIQQDFLFERLT